MKVQHHEQLPMTLWIAIVYFFGILSFFVPVLMAAYLGSRWQAPLAGNFIRFNLTYAFFLATLFSTFLLFDVIPEDGLPLEVFFDSLFFLLYAALLLFLGRFLFEMAQKKWDGLQRRITEGLAVLGVALPLFVSAFVFEGEARVLALRFFLNGIYVYLFLGWVLFLFIQAALQVRSIQDEWKRTTLKGAIWIFFGGIPFFLVDAAWPLLQLDWKILPRGFNVQLLVVLAWNAFFLFRWLTFPTSHAGEKGLDQIAPERMELFTSREREIVLLILQGKTNLEIGAALNVRLGTTKNHIYNIFNKTGASSRKELCRMLWEPRSTV